MGGGSLPIPFLRPFDSAQGERNAPPIGGWIHALAALSAGSGAGMTERVGMMERRSGGGGRLKAAVVVDYGHAAVPAEVSWGDLDAGGGLTALVFVAVDGFDYPLDHFFVEAHVDDLG